MRGDRSRAPAAAVANERALVIGATSMVVAALVATALGLDRLSWDVLTGALTVTVITLVTIPLIRWIARRDGDPGFGRLLLWAFVLKMVFTLVRYAVIIHVYDDNADAGIYSAGAAEMVRSWRAGQLLLDPEVLSTRGSETLRVGIVLAVVYLVTGVSRYAGSFVFSWFCFLGQVLMCRALRRAVPEADHRRYDLLVLFWPSLLFWPASIGKEALMIAAIGVASYGAAILLAERARATGLIIFVAGAGGLLLVRPHMALIAGCALILASAVGALAGVRGAPSVRNAVLRVLALVALLGGAAFATTQLSQIVGEEDDASLSTILEKTQEVSSMGGSEFQPPAVAGVADVPNAVVTVIFRPFPWEAGSLNSLLASAEGFGLLVLLVVSRRRILTWLRTVIRRPYLVYAAAFAFVFVLAFSYIGNFGILARQRTQMLPLLFTLVAMPAAARTGSLFLRRTPADPDETGRTDQEAAAGSMYPDPVERPIVSATERRRHDGGRV